MVCGSLSRLHVKLPEAIRKEGVILPGGLPLCQQS